MKPNFYDDYGALDEDALDRWEAAEERKAELDRDEDTNEEPETDDRA